MSTLICPIPSSSPDYVRTSSRPSYRTRRHFDSRHPDSSPAFVAFVSRARRLSASSTALTVNPTPRLFLIPEAIIRTQSPIGSFAPQPGTGSLPSGARPSPWVVLSSATAYCPVPIMPVCTCSPFPSVRERISLAALFYTAVRCPHTRSSLRHRSAPLHSVLPRLLQP